MVGLRGAAYSVGTLVLILGLAGVLKPLVFPQKSDTISEYSYNGTKIIRTYEAGKRDRIFVYPKNNHSLGIDYETYLSKLERLKKIKPDERKKMKSEIEDLVGWNKD